tara:strand:- start:98 stop:448 length:351 start_codon:yes stop_codon:yes gene_type:complete
MTRIIWQLSNDGKSTQEIERLTGVNRKVVIMTICRGRKSGDCKPRVKTISTVVNASPLTWGSFKPIKGAVSVEQARWLFDEAEKCGCATVAEYVSELVLDVYEEAKAKEAINAYTY